MTKCIKAHELLTKYSAIIFDIWGVIHNGQTLLSGVKQFIDNLNQQNIDYYFLSNAPRPQHLIYEKLTSLGLDIKQDIIITSGDFFLHSFKGPSILDNMQNKKFFLIGSEKNSDLLDNLPIITTTKMEKADLIMMLAYADSRKEIEHYKIALKQAVSMCLPMICTNPDKIADNGAKIRFCQGYFASLYEDIGGKVYYYGKPHASIYEFLFDKYKLDKNRTLVIGDSMTTDIMGACNFKIDSALVMTGIHKDESDPMSFVKTYQYAPTYVLKNLAE